MAFKRSNRCYNSGKISGLTFLTAIHNFSKADDLIRQMGMIPINPISDGLKTSYPYWIHIIYDILLLLTCNNIYFQQNYKDSREANIEYKFAKFFGLNMWFEINPGYDNQIKK